MRKEGQFFVEDYYVNTGGLNTADSPFVVDKSQATGGQNYSYLRRGGFQKRGGHIQLNAAADPQTRTLGYALYDNPVASRAVIRGAGQKIQNFDFNTFLCSNLSEDAAATVITCTITIASPAVITATAHGLAVNDTLTFTTTGALPTGLAVLTTYYVTTVVDANNFRVSATRGGTAINTSGSQSGTQSISFSNPNFLLSGSTQPVVSAMFNNAANTGALWLAGGGLGNLVGAYSSSKVTKNGVAVPTWSSFTAINSGTGGTFPQGNYYYSLVYHKASTGALSNASADVLVTVASGNTQVALAWTLTNNDLTKYDKIYIYRSSVNGSPGFTAGAIVAVVNANVTSYTDTNTLYSSSENVPRANNTILDNSPLPSGTYDCITTWKRRLVTASGSTILLSDTNKPENWPTTNTITVPSGGKITGLAVVSLTSITGAIVDEILCVFKQRELWIVTGTDYTDWQLKFIDNSGNVNPALIVSANGFIAWVNYRGIFMWNGSGKPAYVSQTIEDKWQLGGDLDKSKLAEGFGVFFQSRNEIQWYLSSKSLGEQKYVLKLDLRLTLQALESTLGDRQLKGIFTPDVLSFPVFAGLPYLQSQSAVEELLYLGDGSGNTYNAFSNTGDGVSTDIAMQYVTSYLHMDTPTVSKRFHKVVLYVLDNGVYDIKLDYWADFRFLDGDASSDSRPVAANFQGVGLVWDLGKWDQNYWDTSTNKPKALVYNLSSSNKNNAEGDCLKLRISQTGHLETPIIYGFSVYYTELGTRK